jgi:hypothetical protein
VAVEGLTMLLFCDCFNFSTRVNWPQIFPGQIQSTDAEQAIEKSNNVSI